MRSSLNIKDDDSFGQAGAKIGSSLRIRLPVQFTTTTGAPLSVQNTVETNTTLTLTTQRHVDFSFSTQELTLNIDDFADRYLQPATKVLAAAMESDAFGMANSVYNVVNGAGSAQTFKNVLTARKKLLDNLTPQSKQWQLRVCTQDNVDLVDSLKGLFQQSTQIARQYTEGVMGLSAGFEWAENTLLPSYTRGAQAGYIVGAGSQTGSTLAVTTGTGAGNAGDIFTIQGVFMVHPETKVSTGVLQQFTLTAAATGGAGNWSISPPITVTGAYQNVNASPAPSAPITFVGTASTAAGMSLAYHPDAFTFATADLVMPGGVDMASRASSDGIAIRVVRQYDINSDVLPCRLDVLYGYQAIRPQMACRLLAN